MTSLELFRALILAMPVTVVPDATVEQFLTTASCRLCPESYGLKFAEASVWYAAHLLAMSGILQGGGSTVPGSGGTVTSLKTGDESIGFSAPTAPSGGTSAADMDLMKTHYGQQFLTIRETRAVAAPSMVLISC